MPPENWLLMIGRLIEPGDTALSTHHVGDALRRRDGRQFADAMGRRISNVHVVFLDPSPAIVLILPSRPTLRTGSLTLSTMKRFPSWSMAAPRGQKRRAAVAGPPSPLYPEAPDPATAAAHPPARLPGKPGLQHSPQQGPPFPSPSKKHVAWGLEARATPDVEGCCGWPRCATQRGRRPLRSSQLRNMRVKSRAWGAERSSSRLNFILRCQLGYCQVLAGRFCCSVSLVRSS